MDNLKSVDFDTMEKDKPPKASRYTTDLLEIPGMAFDITVADPKERIQAYINSYRNASQTQDQVGLAQH